MKLHPLHAVSVHAPIACMVLTPLADLGAAITGRGDFEIVAAYLSACAVAFGIVAAMIGALDFDRAFAHAPKTVSWHAVLMACALTAIAISAFGRFADGFAIVAAPPAWAIAASTGALVLAAIGGALGGELVYRHGVNVSSR